jgi:hypothetical protein
VKVECESTTQTVVLNIIKGYTCSTFRFQQLKFINTHYHQTFNDIFLSAGLSHHFLGLGPGRSNWENYGNFWETSQNQHSVKNLKILLFWCFTFNLILVLIMYHEQG